MKYIAMAVAGVALLAAGARPAPPPSESSTIINKQYKRVHRGAFHIFEEGEYKKAVRLLKEHADQNPADLETYYGLALAYAQRGKLDRAHDHAVKAIALGLPAERFYAGPRSLSEPLLNHPPFAEYMAEHASQLVHGPMVGQVTDTRAAIWVRTAAKATVVVHYDVVPSLKNAKTTTAVVTRAERDFTAVVPIRRLTPNMLHYYKVYVGSDPTPLANGSFTTSPPKGDSTSFRVAFGGGSGYVPEHEYVWDAIRQTDPRAFLFLGDNIYIDTPESQITQDYLYYRRQSRPEYRRLISNTAMYATWDDHDFGTNDSWGGPAVDEPYWKLPVWRTFRNNWVNAYYGGGEKQPGTWHHFSIADVDFFMLDSRYYRTDPEGEVLTMLGPAQKAWLLEQVEASTATFKVLASPVPWSKNTKPGSLDTWDGYADEREEIFSFLEANKINGVILICADRHRSDVWRTDRTSGYPLYEFESSRLTNQHVHAKMPDALFSYNEKQSFGILDFDTTKADPEVTYGIVSIDGELVHEHTVALSEITHK